MSAYRPVGGKEFKTADEGKNISVKEMAECTGLSVGVVYKWLNGSGLPTYEPAEDLVELFGLNRIEDMIVMTKSK